MNNTQSDMPRTDAPFGSEYFTDEKLKIALAKMLPDDLESCASGVRWRNRDVRSALGPHVLDTEWLHVCWLVEQTLSRQVTPELNSERNRYVYDLSQECGSLGACMATWQQRALALCKVKGAEV